MHGLPTYAMLYFLAQVMENLRLRIDNFLVPDPFYEQALFRGFGLIPWGSWLVSSLWFGYRILLQKGWSF